MVSTPQQHYTWCKHMTFQRAASGAARCLPVRTRLHGRTPCSIVRLLYEVLTELYSGLMNDPASRQDSLLAGRRTGGGGARCIEHDRTHRPRLHEKQELTHSPDDHLSRSIKCRSTLFRSKPRSYRRAVCQKLSPRRVRADVDGSRVHHARRAVSVAASASPLAVRSAVLTRSPYPFTRFVFA